MGNNLLVGIDRWNNRVDKEFSKLRAPFFKSAFLIGSDGRKSSVLDFSDLGSENAILVRIALSDLNRTSDVRKYIILENLFPNDRLAVLDIVTISAGYHYDIYKFYLKKILRNLPYGYNLPFVPFYDLLQRAYTHNIQTFLKKYYMIDNLLHEQRLSLNDIINEYSKYLLGYQSNFDKYIKALVELNANKHVHSLKEFYNELHALSYFKSILQEVENDDYTSETLKVKYIRSHAVAGGHFAIDEEKNAIKFSGESGDFSNALGFFDCNGIVVQLINMAGLLKAYAYNETYNSEEDVRQYFNTLISSLEIYNSKGIEEFVKFLNNTIC